MQNLSKSPRRTADYLNVSNITRSKYVVCESDRYIFALCCGGILDPLQRVIHKKYTSKTVSLAVQVVLKHTFLT